MTQRTTLLTACLFIFMIGLLAAGDVHASVRVVIEGLRGATLRDNAQRSTGLYAYRDREISAAQVRRLYESAPDEIKRALEPYGYYRAAVEGELTQAGDNWVATFTVRVRTSAKVRTLDIRFAGDGADDVALAALKARYPLAVGDRLVHSRYENGKAALQSAIEGRGYLQARLEVGRVDVHVEDNAADVTLHWETGPRYRMGATRFEGAQFPDEFMRRYVQHREGDYYNADALLKLQRRLIDADYFGFVAVSPSLQDAQDDVVPITVQVAPAPRNVYLGGLSIGTDSGFGVRGSVQRRWVNSRGHKANVEAELSQRLTAAAANYVIPLPGDDVRSLNFGVTHRREETDSSESNTTSVFAMENRLWRGWMRDLGLRALYGDFTIAEQQNSSTLVFAEGRLTRRRANDDLFPTQGYSLRLEARAGAEALLSDTDFAQIRAEARYIHPLGEKQRAYFRGIVGATHVGDFDALPPPLRFFAGGDRTIRGYGYQALGPENEDGFVIGGKHLAVLSAEYERDVARDWAIAGFVDTGNAFSDTSDFRLRTGVGIGVRWRSPVGLVRLDIGHGLDDAQNAIELHVVIGPDL
jgi:translocation and assembly module TamA